MPGTYTQIFIQIIFAVKGRENLLYNPWKQDVFKYMAGILKTKDQKPYLINGPGDHVHILMGLKPITSLSEIVRDIKTGSTHYINQNKFVRGHFSWQEGYGAFSYSKSQIPAVSNYIQNQEEHHRKKTFREEYIAFLKKYEIDHEEKYLLIGFIKLTIVAPATSVTLLPVLRPFRAKKSNKSSIATSVTPLRG